MLPTYGLVPSAFPSHSLNGQRRCCAGKGRGMFSLGDAAPANFVTNIAGEVVVVVSGHKYHK